jgi:hypothetical protein
MVIILAVQAVNRHHGFLSFCADAFAKVIQHRANSKALMAPRIYPVNGLVKLAEGGFSPIHIHYLHIYKAILYRFILSVKQRQ